eukprot:CAMPEP_0179042288 /NCGR_PEP_ID=MMETSP0796-20121207/16588_1 /TAXON_ID=73915 /ORGANISM="Pyrodinium bahamense, Strain pbaha01" /LENGTH=287 /DNA_ID=CAMNT_0020738665 /DNA_START=321 /DNA_END=1184 /DNA_ORIENTATION=-
MAAAAASVSGAAIALVFVPVHAGAKVAELGAVALAAEPGVEQAHRQVVLVGEPHKAECGDALQGQPLLGLLQRFVAAAHQAHEHAALAAARAPRVGLDALGGDLLRREARLRHHVGVLGGAERGHLLQKPMAVVPSVEIAGHQALPRVPEQRHHVGHLGLGCAREVLAAERRVIGVQAQEPAARLAFSRQVRAIDRLEALGHWCEVVASDVSHCRGEVAARLRNVHNKTGHRESSCAAFAALMERCSKLQPRSAACEEEVWADHPGATELVRSRRTTSCHTAIISKG